MPAPKDNTAAVIGEFFIDEIFSGFNTLPKLGEEAFARKFQREVGGGAAITACGLAKLGVKVIALGAVGESDGAWVIDRLHGMGVDCSGLQLYPDEPTGVTISVSTREDRAFFTYYGANSHLEDVLLRPETMASLESCRYVHFACAPNVESSAPLFEALRKRSRISIDVQFHVSWLTQRENLRILRLCDVFFPNESEARWISATTGPHEMLCALREMGIRGVGLKLGGRGGALLWRRSQFLIDPFPVETIDTTGAGDCFNAGFLFARMRGYKPRRCLAIANICGALSTRALGGVAGFPTPQELADCESMLGRER